MVRCEFCSSEHPGTYASGRFCDERCARAFSTKGNRASINNSVSIKLKGISPKTGYALTAEDRAKGAVNGAAAKVRKNRELTLSLPFKELYSRKAKKKRIIFEQTGCCEICGSHEWLGKPIPLELDHIDGNKENEERNNLRCICPNCHSFTPTYKGKNVKVRGRVGKVYEGVLKTPA